MKNFYSLKVEEIESLTPDAVKITLHNSYPDQFNFIAGQYITLHKEINNQDVRRSYSLSSYPGEGIEIGIRRIENGLMSSFLTKELKVGDTLDVMPPTGNFYLDAKQEGSHYLAICAGSGITPIISMIKQVLANDSDSYFTLIYGNKTRSSMMFLEDLNRLEREYQSQGKLEKQIEELERSQKEIDLQLSEPEKFKELSRQEGFFEQYEKNQNIKK